MDFLRYTCARCGAKLESPKELADQTERCPGCGQVNRIPKARQRSEKKSFLRSLFGSSSPPASDAAPTASPAARPSPSPKAKTGRDSTDATYQIRSVGQKNAKQMQLIRSRIQELSNKKACAAGRSVDAEFKA